MRDQKDNKQKSQNSQPQQNRPSNERKQQVDTLAGGDDEPQICRGID